MNALASTLRSLPRSIFSLEQLMAMFGILLPFGLPVASLLFYVSGPQSLEAALLWTLPVWLYIAADYWSPTWRVKTDARPLPSSLFTLGLISLAVLQWINILGMLTVAAQLRFDSPELTFTALANLTAMRILTGTTSCCSGLSVAHELIHRRSTSLKWLGRSLLWTVMYDHFAIEHVLGHHRHASTGNDPATARFGERFAEFWPRTLKEQWLDAWRLEVRRSRQSSERFALLFNRVLHGLVIQLIFLAWIILTFGVLALVIFAYQALAAVKLLETVNYFQHWGLQRNGRRFSGTDAWATESWLTRQVFLGLSAHADHHRSAAKPYQSLLPDAASPRLPYGYFVMSLLIRFDDDGFRRYATATLTERVTAERYAGSADLIQPPNAVA